MSEWQDISGAEEGMPVFVGWQGTGYQATLGHREGEIWGYLTKDMGFEPFWKKPTHFMPMIYSPPPPAEGAE